MLVIVIRRGPLYTPRLMKFLLVVATFLTGGAVLSLGLAQSAQAQTRYSSVLEFRVSGRVTDHRIIVVDTRSNILQIISNTNQDVTPEVRLVSQNGPQLALSPGVARSYQYLEKQLRDNHIGSLQRLNDPLSLLMPVMLSASNSSSYLMKTVKSGISPSSVPYLVYSTN